jgi:hypothetical protein
MAVPPSEGLPNGRSRSFPRQSTKVVGGGSESVSLHVTPEKRDILQEALSSPTGSGNVLVRWYK